MQFTLSGHHSQVLKSVFGPVGWIDVATGGRSFVQDSGYRDHQSKVPYLQSFNKESGQTMTSMTLML